MADEDYSPSNIDLSRWTVQGHTPRDRGSVWYLAQVGAYVIFLPAVIVVAYLLLVLLTER